MEQPSRTGIGRAVVPARAALAGNPSDGYGGAVVAVPVPAFAATVEVEFGDVAVDDARPVRDRDAPGSDSELDALVSASLRAAGRLVGAPLDLDDRASVRVSTTIPRSVGLAGSSAIVIGVLRAACAAAPRSDWATELARPDAFAVVALDAEVTDLGIAAGLQDRLVQAHSTPLLMEFGDEATVEVLGRPCGTSEPLPAPPGHLLLAHRVSASGSSGVVHGALARRSDLGATMAALADAARDAAAAIRARSADALAGAMDRTFDLRAAAMDLDPAHVEMVERARNAGASANYTGSGGAVVALCRDRRTHAAAAAALADLAGCTVTEHPLAPSATGGV